MEAYRKGQILGGKQDGNRELISCLAAICADGTFIPPALLYQGKSYDIQSSWVQDLGEETVYFAATEKGWTSNDIGLQWLQKIFHPYTMQKSRGKRLLIIDGHISHVNMAFFNCAISNNILILVLPSHSTHRLQPLDVGLFSPLSKAYDKQI